MERIGAVALRSVGFAPSRLQHVLSLALLYEGQSFELEIKQTSGDIARSFHEAHRARYGYAQDSNIEVVSARVRSTGLVDKLSQQPKGPSRRKKVSKPERFTQAYVDGERLKVAVYDRNHLSPGEQLRVPCIVTEYSSTTLIPSGTSAAADGYGNLIIRVT
jgi:N-methylhydantoinase A